MENTHYYWQGKRIKLRPLQADDWKLTIAEEDDSEGIRVLEAGIQLPRSAQQLQDSYREAGERMLKLDETSTINFIVETLDGEPVGAVWMHSRNPRNGTFSFAVRISRSYRRQGYAAEAIRILLKYGFEELRYHKANSATISSNEASIQLHQALGFKIEGRLRDNVYTNGQYYDEVLFGMTRDEYDQVKRNAA
jgi:RimJ/RimL family protein N-acetyltransferase